ncbi:MAG: fused MFS/spermidine synthase, partial [Rhodospirillales bacterium]|nr:fused MFS/spermidine synthase [Rhodospirillales bacterium]
KIADGVRPGRLAVLLAASAIGSVAGSALSGFVLLETVGAVGLARGIAWLWIVLGLVILPWHGVRPSLRLLALLPVVIAVLLSFRPNVGKACWTETRYTCIQISDKTAQNGDLLRVMALDEGLHSLSDREHPERLHLPYAALVDKLAQVAFVGSATPRALVIGGGGATLPRAWAQMHDRRVAAEAADMMWADSPNIRTIIGDGRAVLRSLKHEPLFDVVLMDAYRSHSVPAHLVSREFNAEVERHLTKPGVFLSNVIDRYASLHLAASVAATLRQTFPVVDVWITDADGAGMTNAVIAAWSDKRILYHWAAPGYLMLFPLLGREIAARIDQAWVRRTLIGTAALLLAAIAVIGTQERLDWLGPQFARLRKDPTAEGLDWTSLRTELDARGLLPPGTVVGVPNWRDAGKIGRALGPEVPIVVLDRDARQFGIVASMVGRSLLVLVVEHPAQVAATLAPRFAALTPLPPAPVSLRGRVLLQVAPFRGEDFHGLP